MYRLLPAALDLYSTSESHTVIDIVLDAHDYATWLFGFAERHLLPMAGLPDPSSCPRRASRTDKGLRSGDLTPSR